MNIGTQYKLDDEFKAVARLFQSKYRADVLGVEFEDYGNRLTDSDAQALLNYYGKLNCREVLRKRYPVYSRKRDADLLRSEHIPFNLLAPLDTDREAARVIISRACGIQCKEIQSVEIEYAPFSKEKYLNDGTAFDTYVKAELTDGRTCGIGIEVKYTEQDYPIGVTEKKRVKDHHSLYWSTARASGCFKNPDDEIFGTDPFRQVWRNHLLGLSMIQLGDIDLFYSVILFPDGNTHFHTVIPRYKSLLKEDNHTRVIGCTFEQYIAAIDGASDFQAWKKWLERRYIIK
jgi:hypothetical protein